MENGVAGQWGRRWSLSPSRRQRAVSLYDADPAMILPVRRSSEVNICNQVHSSFLERFGQLYECLCLDSHYCHLVRFTTFIILDLAGKSQIHFFYLGDY